MSDVYAFAVLVCEIVSREDPFNGEEHEGEPAKPAIGLRVCWAIGLRVCWAVGLCYRPSRMLGYWSMLSTYAFHVLPVYDISLRLF
eukprot:3419902-Rhodomonas_salina.2